MTMKIRTVPKIMIPTVMAALLWSGAMALDTAEKQLELGFPVEDGATLRIENLLGSVNVRMLRDKGPVRVEARVVAEGKSEQEASDLVATVELLQSTADGVETIHVGYPLDTVTAFRPPKNGLKGLFSRWSSALMRRGTSAVEYEGRSVDISKDRKAAGLAVEVFGADRVIEHPPIAASEDFSYFLQNRPGAFVFVGASNEAKGIKCWRTI